MLNQADFSGIRDREFRETCRNWGEIEIGRVWYNWFVLIDFDPIECGSSDQFLEFCLYGLGRVHRQLKPIRLRVHSFAAAKRRLAVSLWYTDGLADERKL
jgi:hypothetical protein